MQCQLPQLLHILQTTRKLSLEEPGCLKATISLVHLDLEMDHFELVLLTGGNIEYLFKIHLCKLYFSLFGCYLANCIFLCLVATSASLCRIWFLFFVFLNINSAAG